MAQDNSSLFGDDDDDELPIDGNRSSESQAIHALPGPTQVTVAAPALPYPTPNQPFSQSYAPQTQNQYPTQTSSQVAQPGYKDAIVWYDDPNGPPFPRKVTCAGYKSYRERDVSSFYLDRIQSRGFVKLSIHAGFPPAPPPCMHEYPHEDFDPKARAPAPPMRPVPRRRPLPQEYATSPTPAACLPPPPIDTISSVPQQSGQSAAAIVDSKQKELVWQWRDSGSGRNDALWEFARKRPSFEQYQNYSFFLSAKDNEIVGEEILNNPRYVDVEQGKRVQRTKPLSPIPPRPAARQPLEHDFSGREEMSQRPTILDSIMRTSPAPARPNPSYSKIAFNEPSSLQDPRNYGSTGQSSRLTGPHRSTGGFSSGDNTPRPSRQSRDPNALILWQEMASDYTHKRNAVEAYGFKTLRDDPNDETRFRLSYSESWRLRDVIQQQRLNQEQDADALTSFTLNILDKQFEEEYLESLPQLRPQPQLWIGGSSAAAFQSQVENPTQGSQQQQPQQHQPRPPGPPRKTDVPRKDAPFKGQLNDHPEWWGSFYDDGPKHPEEGSKQYPDRVRKAQSNIQIHTRGLRPVPPAKTDGQSEEDHKRIKKDHNERHDNLELNHGTRLRDDWVYAIAWKFANQQRKFDNAASRREELQNFRKEYHIAYPDRPRPLSPQPPENEGDRSEGESYYDPTPRPVQVPKPAGPQDKNAGYNSDDGWYNDKNKFGEYRKMYPNREHMICRRCKKKKKRCTFKEKTFPCTPCKEAHVTCVRQKWKAGDRGQGAPLGAVGKPTRKGLDLYLPSRYVRKILGNRAPRAWKPSDPLPPESDTAEAQRVVHPPAQPHPAVRADHLATRFRALGIDDIVRPHATDHRFNTPCGNCSASGYLLCPADRPCFWCREARKPCSQESPQYQGYGEIQPRNEHDHPGDVGRYDDGYGLSGGNEQLDLQDSPPEHVLEEEDIMIDPYDRHWIFRKLTNEELEDIAIENPMDPRLNTGSGYIIVQPQTLSPGHQASPTYPAGSSGSSHQALMPGQNRKRDRDDSEDDETGSRFKRQKGTSIIREAGREAIAASTHQPSDIEAFKAELERPLTSAERFPIAAAAQKAPTNTRERIPRQHLPLEEPCWYINILPAPQGDIVSGSADDRDLKCNEKRGYWQVQTFHFPCHRVPAKACEAVDDNKALSCNLCNEEQRTKRRPLEMAMYKKDSSRLYCCSACRPVIRARVEAAIPGAYSNACCCSRQLQQARICNDHRVQGYRLVQTRLESELLNHRRSHPGWENYGSLKPCPRCNSAADAEGPAWQCLACKTYVYNFEA